ncbi:hypothetical protein SOPP22_00480 [Shewanella sp. OPT22]|nr:hypothetical protein SOPP22_00480 [Shewanella sp. OPT22]
MEKAAGSQVGQEYTPLEESESSSKSELGNSFMNHDNGFSKKSASIQFLSLSDFTHSKKFTVKNGVNILAVNDELAKFLNPISLDEAYSAVEALNKELRSYKPPRLSWDKKNNAKFELEYQSPKKYKLKFVKGDDKATQKATFKEIQIKEKPRSTRPDDIGLILNMRVEAETTLCQRLEESVRRQYPSKPFDMDLIHYYFVKHLRVVSKPGTLEEITASAQKLNDFFTKYDIPASCSFEPKWELSSSGPQTPKTDENGNKIYQFTISDKSLLAEMSMGDFDITILSKAPVSSLSQREVAENKERNEGYFKSAHEKLKTLPFLKELIVLGGSQLQLSSTTFSADSALAKHFELQELVEYLNERKYASSTLDFLEYLTSKKEIRGESNVKHFKKVGEVVIYNSTIANEANEKFDTIQAELQQLKECFWGARS